MYMNNGYFSTCIHTLLKRKLEYAFSFIPHTQADREKPWLVSFVPSKRMYVGEEIVSEGAGFFRS